MLTALSTRENAQQQDEDAERQDQIAAGMGREINLADMAGLSSDATLLSLDPFRYSRQFSGVNCAPALAASMAEALSAAGLPE